MRKRASAAVLMRADSLSIDSQLPTPDAPNPKILESGSRSTGSHQTEAGATPGCAMSASRAPSLNGWSGGSTSGRGADALMLGVDAWRRRARLDERLHRAQQPLARHDDARCRSRPASPSCDRRSAPCFPGATRPAWRSLRCRCRSCPPSARRGPSGSRCPCSRADDRCPGMTFAWMPLPARIAATSPSVSARVGW